MIAPVTAPGTGQRRRFGPSPVGVFPVAVLLLGSLPLATAASWLLVVVLVPLALATWVLRARVVLADAGLEVCNGGPVHRLPWDAVEGFTVPRRGPVRLLRSGARPLLLTALPRGQLGAFRSAAEQFGSARP